VSFKKVGIGLFDYRYVKEEHKKLYKQLLNGYLRAFNSPLNSLFWDAFRDKKGILGDLGKSCNGCLALI
jgi:hypothetical protein